MCCYDTIFVFLSGLYVYSSKETKLVVDTSRGDRLRINVSTIFFELMAVRDLMD